MTNLDSMLKSRDITLPTKVRLVKAMVFPVVMYGCVLDYKESWAPKNWCSWTVLLEKTLENPLDCMEIQQVNPKGDQSWVFIGRTDTEAETPLLWPHDCKEQLTHCKRSWSREILKAGEGDSRGWDDLMASLTQWTWVWVDSGSWWWTGMSGVLRFVESRRVGQDWVTELNRTDSRKRSNQSILKEIIHEYSLEGLMQKLKLQCFGHLMQRVDSLEKTQILGKIEGKRRRRWQRMTWLDGITDSVDIS